MSERYPLPYVDMIYAGLMSIVNGARKSAEADDEWVRRGERLQNLTKYEVRVPARTLTSVLEEYKVNRIDLLSLDVEGYEIEVLKGLDFSRFRPLYVVFEDSGADDIGEYLRQYGYSPVAVLLEGRFTRDILYRAP